jgi:ABC-type oligopeptide transport system substrate-binding subunit
MPSFTMSSRFRFAKPLLALVLGAALATLAACGSDTTNGTGPMDVSGNYSLTMVNSSTLPYTIPHTPEHTIVISSATGTLGADHSYSINATGTEDGGDPVQVVADAGTYTVSGSTVTFTSSTFGGGSYTAAAASGTLTAVVPGAFAGSTDVTFSLIFTKS